MQVRVIVLYAGRMVGRELELVLEALAGRDAQEDVVRVALGRDVEPVRVEVRVAGGRVLGAGVTGQRGAPKRVIRRQPFWQCLQGVDQVDAQGVPGSDTQ